MKDERLYLIHMRECAERILAYTSAGREEFLSDPKTQDAVLRNFEVLGEAAKRVSAEIRSQLPEIPWRQVAGFRDVLIHQYEGVDLREVWKRVETTCLRCGASSLSSWETSEAPPLREARNPPRRLRISRGTSWLQAAA